MNIITKIECGKRNKNRVNIYIDEEYALTIMKNQISSDKKKEMADIVLDNTKDQAFLYQQIEQLMKGIENERITDK